MAVDNRKYGCMQSKGCFGVPHKRGGGLMSRRALDRSSYSCYIVQAVGNLHCSSSYEAPASPSAQPAQHAALRPVSPSQTA